MRRLLLLAIVLAACLGAPRASGRAVSVVEWLDAYRAGRFDLVTSALERETNFTPILEQLKRDGPGWIAAAGAAEVERRELVAATFALEAARVGMRYDWKYTKRQPPICIADDCYEPLSVLTWRAPPLLIEWGCALFLKDATPRPIERWWQLAALSVAQRAEDPQFLVGDVKIGKGVGAGEIINTQQEIKHLDHIWKRISDQRFVLGQGIARDRDWPEDAVQAYRALEKDPIVGGEALMRLGAMQMRARQFAEALKSFDRVETLTRDPYVVFLANYFSGQIYERQPNLRLAEIAYRRAAAAVPHAQSATLALAAIVARDGRRSEAQQLVREMLEVKEPPLDPWRRFVHADDRFWPQLVNKLRAEIAQ